MRKVVEHEHLTIPLHDGTRLAARMWLPEDADADPVPAILEYLPYRKRDGTCARDALTHPWFAARGYACVRVDIRGNGDSDGLMHDEYTATELSDGAEVIAWLAAQSWCSGQVGIMGISWGGFNGLQLAALRPPALGAVVTLCSTDDRYADDIHYKGGLLLNENLGWGATMLSYSSRPPDPVLVGEHWREMWLDRLEAQPFLAHVWALHPTRDDYWKHGSVCEDFAAIEAPVLAVGGWGDAYKNAVPRLLDGLACPAKGIVGPWVHKYPHFAVPEPRIGFLQEALRWWDRWLKGVENGVESLPDYRAYVLDSEPPRTWYRHRLGRWVAVDGVLARAQAPRRFALCGDGVLVETQAQAPPLDVTVATPLDCGLDGGEYCAIWLGPELPGDQRRDDALARSFDSPPLAAPLAMLGAPVVEFTLSCDRRVAQLAVRLEDVAPDGASTRVTYGVLNLCHRDSHAAPTALAPDEPFEVRIALDHIGYRVAAGNRLRVAVSSAYWPLVWPSPEKATLTLLSGTIVLPSIDIDAFPEPAFEAPDAAAPWDVEVVRAPRHERTVERDLVANEVTVSIVDDFGRERDRAHGLETGSVARERWMIAPDDPLSARGETHWTQTLARGDWSVRTETRSSMRCDATTFLLEAEVTAFEGEEKVFEKRWREQVPRECL